MTTREGKKIDTVWSGTWVADRLGVRLEDAEGAPGGPRLTELLGLALRRNPKRAHLLVSQVLGKHVPQSPRTVYAAGYGLGERVRALLGDEAAASSVVLGYAETATGLGHCVADGLGAAPYLHSTRRPVPGVRPAGGFEEAHSHATSHLLLPEDPRPLAGGGPLVLVDDEFSTGNTVLNTIRDLHARHPRAHYVVVALVDMRSPADRDRLTAFAAEIGARVDLIALATGTVHLPEGVLAKGQALVEEHEAGEDRAAAGEEQPASPQDQAAAAQDQTAAAQDQAAAGEDQAVAGEDRPAWAQNRPVAGQDHPAPAQNRPASMQGQPAAGEDRPESAQEQGASVQGQPGAGQEQALRPAGSEVPGGSASAPARGPRPTARVALDWPAGVPDGGRHGFTTAHRTRLEAVLPALTAQLTAALGARPGRILVLGNEELMYAPLRLAKALEEAGAGDEVRFSTTTRSPVLAVDDPGYAIRTRLVFPAHDAPADGPGDRYAYNVAGAGFDTVIAVVDSAGDTPDLRSGLLDALAPHTGRVVLAVVPSYIPERQEPIMPEPLPEPLRGPAFSSYAPEDVGWLLQDLSAVELEAPTEEREEAIQAGGAHYAESLPVEYQPSPQYQELYRSALTASAARMARAVGTVTETVLAERSPSPVLVSLARAGTPVGVLMRRWARARHGLDLPHYAVSIVRGRGIDANALRWLAAHHDPADVVFVDGWTGKGAITRELREALAAFDGFNPEIVVLADPGSCVETYGTREDFLIPSACLNSTVSGLVSRTVLRSDLVGPADFHGAKFYRELAGADVSVEFVDTVAAHFDEVADAVADEVKELLAADRTPTWEGWAAVERISEEYGIHDVNLVKPGVGETTRVLLRRVPWKILAQRGAGADLDHVRLLAEQRGVPVEEVDGLPYTCVGLIHPRFTRGATGADGKAVASK
ncbi:phosphoribosyltransferase [Streptomyces sp. NPDC046685]|uniref:phosphoribosyltransferase n=1 Tax=Streptomyces sp. NPDC046685 TaxID=3157202 RepID=UPI0033EF4BA0